MHAHSLSPRHLRRWRHRGDDEGQHRVHRFFHHGRGGRSVRRGKVRLAILSVLRAQPMHGYQVIQELETRSQGRWRPSAGSIYPTLQLLEDEGLVSSAEVEGRRVYSLTDGGRTVAEEQAPDPEALLAAGADGEPSLPELAGRLVAAAAELDRTGTTAGRAAARDALVDARKRLYRLLADDDDATPGPGG